MAQASFRVAVGTPTGRRSTVWKFVVRGNEVYILSRMFGSDVKVSLHGDGRCQFSRTDAWVKKTPGARNADRHMQRWRIFRPIGNCATHVFRVRIPQSELRAVDSGEDLEEVDWLPARAPDETVSFECHMTPPTENDPCLVGNLPAPVLFRARLLDGRWFVVLHHVAKGDVPELQRLRDAEVKQACARGYVPQAHHRATMFGVDDRNVRGLIETLVVP